MTSLTDVYCDWFETLAPEVAKELAVHVMRLFPGGLLTPTLTTPDATDGLAPRIRRLAEASKFADAGLALTLAALTDFVFMSRSDPAQWAEDRALLEVLDEARTAVEDAMDPDLSRWLAENRLRYPLRARQWTASAETWGPVRRGPLSDAEIHAALKRSTMAN